MVLLQCLWGNLQVWGTFQLSSVSLFVAQELPFYCQRSSLPSSCCCRSLQLLGCQLWVPNMLPAAIHTHSKASRDQRSLPGAMQLSSSLLCPHSSLALSSWTEQTFTFVTAKPLSSVGSHFPFPALILCPFKPELLSLLICIEWSLNNNPTLNGISTYF